MRDDRGHAKVMLEVALLTCAVHVRIYIVLGCNE